MSFNWLDFLRLATALAGTDASDSLAEAKWRTAASRAYYAAYHAAGDHYRDHLLRRHGPMPVVRKRFDGTSRRLNRHEMLIEGFRAIGTDLSAHIGDLLSGAKAIRVDADYRAEEPMTGETARDAVELARKIHEALGS